jgi:peptide/nickel transport system substrate-binding protein
MRKMTLVLLLAALAAGLILAGCKPGGTAAGKTLVYGTTEKVTDMDPANAYDFHTWEIFQNVYQGLMTYEPGTTTLVPGLAESYSANAKSDEFTFKLRKNLKFSDGTALKADAIKWTIDRVTKLKGDPSWLITDFVQQVDVVDELTVKFKLKGPTAFFPALVASPPYFPLNPKVYPADKIVRNVDELVGKKLVGPGPYQATSFKRDQEVVLEANKNYWGPKPNINRIVIRYFADATTMRLALEKGEVDLAFKSFNPSDIKDLAKKSDITTYKLNGPQIRYLCFETSELVFKDKRLRQAMSMLVDRQEIIDKVYLGQNTPLYTMVPVGMIYHTPSFKDVYGEKPDVAKADKLLAEAGYTAAKPLRFELWYTPSHYGDAEVNMAEVLKAQLEKSKSVKVTVKTAEWATYKDQWKKKQMPFYFLGWYPDYIDPDNYTAAFGGTEGSKGQGINFSKPEWDKWFTTEQNSPDPAVRKQTFEQVQKAWTDEVPTLPLWQGDLYVFTKPKVKDVKIGPTLIFNYNVLKFAE